MIEVLIDYGPKSSSASVDMARMNTHQCHVLPHTCSDPDVTVLLIVRPYVISHSSQIHSTPFSRFTASVSEPWAQQDQALPKARTNHTYCSMNGEEGNPHAFH